MTGCQNTCIDKLLGGRQVRKHPTVKKLMVETPSGTGSFAIQFGQFLLFEGSCTVTV